MECVCCYEEIKKNQYLFTEKKEVYSYCLDCFSTLKKEKRNYVHKILAEDCLKSLKNMLNKGIPLLVIDNENKIFHEDRDINSVYADEYISIIQEINEELKKISELYTDDSIKVHLHLFFNSSTFQRYFPVRHVAS